MDTPVTTIKDQYRTYADSQGKVAEPVVGYGVTVPEKEIDWGEVLDKIKSGVTVKHKTFGIGTVVKITSDHKIHVKFNAGQKMFIFPDAFVNGLFGIRKLGLGSSYGCCKNMDVK